MSYLESIYYLKDPKPYGGTFPLPVFPVSDPAKPRHVGFRKISRLDGVTTFDYINFPGVPFVTTKVYREIPMVAPTMVARWL